MQEIGAFDAKNRLGALLDQVEMGEEIVITRRGKPIARLVPSSSMIDRSQINAAADRIRERGASLKARFDWEAIRADRDTGRL
jgi:prevent-host-death family protein